MPSKKITIGQLKNVFCLSRIGSSILKDINFKINAGEK
jgi:ABC-type molybdenum transport system ATPase subunit/photorepair protein PhrA